MTAVAVGLLIILAGFLMVSAAAKVVSPGAAAAALKELGLTHRAAVVAVIAGVVVEAAVAAAIVLWPRAWAAQVTYVALFGVFAALAALALRSGRALECGCFGAVHRSALGRTQFLQFALVVPSVIVVAHFAPVWSIQTGLAVLTLALIAASGLFLAIMSPVWWQIRRDRVSLGSVQAYVRQNGWPEMPLLPETEVASR